MDNHPVPTPFDGIEDRDSDSSYVRLAYDVAPPTSTPSAPFGVSKVPSPEDFEDGEDDEGYVSAPIVLPPAEGVEKGSAEEVETPKTPKRGPGRPPKKRPAPAAVPADETADYHASLTAIAVENTADQAWLKLNELRALELEGANIVADAEDEVSAAQEAEDAALAEVQRWNQVLADATDRRATAESNLVECRKKSVEMIARGLSVQEVMSTVEGYLRALTGGKSGRVGAVRITVIDNKTHIDPT